MNVRRVATFGIILTAIATGTARLASQPQVDHPTKLPIKPVTFTPPSASQFRAELENGLVAFVAEDKQFPLVSIRAIVRAGSLYDPPEASGMTRTMARYLPQAATEQYSAADVRDLLRTSGGELTVSAAEAALTIDLSMHARDARDAVRLLAGLLRAPRFSDELLATDRKTTSQTVFGAGLPETEVRNRFNRILYKDHPLVRPGTPALLSKISASDLQQHHARFVRPGSTVLMVAGDVPRAQVLAWLGEDLKGWAPADPRLPDVPSDLPAPARKIYLVHQAGLKQAFGHAGHRGIRWSSPDYFAVLVMNWILTGSKVYYGIGAFSGRLWFQLRTNRGISSMGYGELWDTFHYPPPFVMYWKGREEKTGVAVSVIAREIEKIRSEPVSPLDLQTAKNFYLYSLPGRFYTAEETVRTFGQLEFDKLPLDYYDRFQAAIAKVTADDVLRAAKNHLRPEEMFFVILGDADRIQKFSETDGIRLDAIAPVEVVRPE